MINSLGAKAGEPAKEKQGASRQDACYRDKEVQHCILLS